MSLTHSVLLRERFMTNGRLYSRSLVGAASAISITVPHALGLGLIAFAPIADQGLVSAMALWSAALPAVLMALVAGAKGVVHAPSSVVALLFGEMLSLVMRFGADQGITVEQGLAVTGAFVCLSFALQWLIGRAGLASLSRFLPISVIQGFSAGVGISLMVTQLRNALGAGTWRWSGTLAWSLGAAALVGLLSMLLQRRWPRFPSLLLALVASAALLLAIAPAGQLPQVLVSSSPALPPLPDWLHAPWLVVLERVGPQLMSLALLMALVNALEVLVFYQEIETVHGVRTPAGARLMRSSPWSALTALLGMIPASASPSRSRTALQYTIAPTAQVDRWHAGIMVTVAATGHLWLGWLPTACLAGALLMAGAKMIPDNMLRLERSAAVRSSFWQSWLVAVFFAFMGGAMALIAGLIVATTDLLRTSGRHAIRRMHLGGHLRSRHVRRTEVERWLAGRMADSAVFELQGIVSFGVAALVVDQILHNLGRHRFVIVEASRVPAWDDTGYARLLAMSRELESQGVTVVASGMRRSAQGQLDGMRHFEDLDHALEWVEDQVLRDCPAELLAPDAFQSPLGELGEGLPAEVRTTLVAQMRMTTFAPGELIFEAGDSGRTMMLVQTGDVTLSATSDARKRLRLSVIGPGMFFGEMAFLNGVGRTAFAHAGMSGAVVWSLDWEVFQAWTRSYPDHALAFMNHLAQLFIRRFMNTSQELRAALA